MAVKLTANFKAIQKNGELIVVDSKSFATQLRQFGDKELIVTVKPFRSTRSNQENKYYWKIIVGMIAEEMGFIELEQCHAFLKETLLREKMFVKICGKIKEISVPVSSASLTTAQFEDYCAKCRTWASLNFGMYIPLPGEAEAY